MRRKVVYTDAPPEIDAALERSVPVSREEIGLPSPEWFRATKQRKVTENGITRIYFTHPSSEVAEIKNMSKKQSSFFAGKVAVL